MESEGVVSFCCERTVPFLASKQAALSFLPALGVPTEEWAVAEEERGEGQEQRVGEHVESGRPVLGHI